MLVYRVPFDNACKFNYYFPYLQNFCLQMFAGLIFSCNFADSMKKFCFVLIYICLLSACTGGQDRGVDDDSRAVEMKYAELLDIRRGDEYTTVTVRNPWDSTAILHRYVLIAEGKEAPKDISSNDIIKVPLKNTAVYTSILCSLMDEIGAMEAIKGVCDVEYIYMDKVQKGVADGSIIDLGSSMTPNIEKLMDMHPDAMFISPFENSGSYGKLGKLHIPIIECADYMETTPLGRAEWMRFYGMLFGKEQEADSIFATVEQNYNAMKALADKQPVRPTVVTEMKTGSTWYVAGGKSTVNILITDAGGEYIFKDIESGGAVPYSPEQVFAKAQGADYWLIKYNQATDMTLNELGEAWATNRHMAAYVSKNVYGCNLSKKRFFEETPFHPDILLRDYINILHPGVLEDKEITFYKRL